MGSSVQISPRNTEALFQIYREHRRVVMGCFGLDELKAIGPAPGFLQSSQMRRNALLTGIGKHAAHPAFKGARVIRPAHLKADQVTVRRGRTEVNPTMTIHRYPELFSHLFGSRFRLSGSGKHWSGHRAQTKQRCFINRASNS